MGYGDRMRPVAAGNCNWDYYKDTGDRIVSVAKPLSGCSTTSFGSVDYFRFMVKCHPGIFAAVFVDVDDPALPLKCPLTTKGPRR